MKYILQNIKKLKRSQDERRTQPKNLPNHDREATSTIREAILKRVYKPGTRLIPGKLERELSLGRVAIREALREL